MRFNDIKLSSTSLLIVLTVTFGAVVAFGAALTMDDPSAVMAVTYATFFIAIAWKYPPVALAITFASGPFQEDLSSGFGPFRFSIAEINLLLCAVIFIFRRITLQKGIKLSPTTIPILVYLGICVASSLAEWRQDTVVPSLLQIILYFVVAMIVFSNFVENPEQLVLTLYFLLIVCLFLSIMGLSTGSFFVMGLHKNGAGASLACGVIVSMELWLGATQTKRKAVLFIATSIILAGLIFSLSRGAWIGALSGLFVVIVFRRKFKFLLQISAAMIPLIAICWNLLPEDKKDYATSFDPSRVNISARYESIEFAKLKFEENPIYGVGVGLRKEYDATNVIWVTLAETGVPGLIAFLLIHVVFLLMCYKAQKQIDRNDKLYSLLAVGGALIVNKMMHGIVDHYWSRGALLIAWASAGMATAVYFELRRRAYVHDEKLMADIREATKVAADRKGAQRNISPEATG